MEPGAPTAAEIDALPSTPLVLGRWIKADLHRIEWRGRALVVKSFARKSLPVRLLGRPQIAREARAYAALRGVAGIPALHGRPDPYTLVMDFVEGERLTHVRLTEGPKRQFIDALGNMVEAMHARGVAHLDLSHRSNVMLDDAGHPYLIDFGSAICFRPGGLGARLLLPLLASARHGLSRGSAP